MTQHRFLLLCVFLSLLFQARAVPVLEKPEESLSPRFEYDLCQSWETTLAKEAGSTDFAVQPDLKGVLGWQPVSLPHNWDGYAPLQQMRHGNLHGAAYYRRHFSIDRELAGLRAFLFFEGAGSFATVWLNGTKVGEHGGALTCFNLDVTEVLKDKGADNELIVRIAHPAGIRNLPWVCGGCERVGGFSEGSQPFGINRPLRLVVTAPVRITPFGVHIWNDDTVSPAAASAHLKVEAQNFDRAARSLRLRNRLLSPGGELLQTREDKLVLQAGQRLETADLRFELKAGAPGLPSGIQLWSPGSPALHHMETELLDENGRVLDRVRTRFGFRKVQWPSLDKGGPLLLNGQPLFLEGTCEYPHLLGASHAFGTAQIAARVEQIRAAGFNAFRDAHHPHDLRYSYAWDSLGLAWWTQFSAHVWFDRPDFRNNFKKLLVEWVRERRNSPSLILWGLQNESLLPEDFARECTELIRSLDPTASTQRLVTTCNNGKGTDWDVPQNWSGTYGGNPDDYAAELKRQILVGEYGAWRSVDARSESPQEMPDRYSEDQMLSLLETKARLARTVSLESVGHFQWIFSTHENPGRSFGSKGEQLAEGWATVDRLGPANNKGLLTLWGEPLDAYAMYRSLQTDPRQAPVVQIVGENNPDRLTEPGILSRVSVYTNCEEVELFNDVGTLSLGVRKRPADGRALVWENVPLKHRLLLAVARQQGRDCARDMILLNHLPAAPHEAALDAHPADSTAPRESRHYLFRVNCGGSSYIDSHGKRWLADKAWTGSPDDWGYRSWSSDFPHLAPNQALSRRINMPVLGTRDSALYQDFNYGREKLAYHFPLSPGEYEVELHFMEPWYGRGTPAPAAGERLFDVALNGKTYLHDLDVAAEAGHARALVKHLSVTVGQEGLDISFPRVASYQALVSAIAISRRSPQVQAGGSLSSTAWLTTGQPLFASAAAPSVFSLPPNLIRREYLPLPKLFPGVHMIMGCDTEIVLGWLGEPAQVTGNWELLPETVALAPEGSLRLTRGFLSRGETLSLPAGIPLALLVRIPAPTPPSPQVLGQFLVDGCEPSGAWAAYGLLGITGARPWGAAAPALKNLPVELGDADWLRLPADKTQRAKKLSFVCNDTAEVCLALKDDLKVLPSWLEDWSELSSRLSVDGVALRILRKRFPAGAKVELPGSLSEDGAPYPVFCRLMRPAFRVSPPAGSPVLLTEGKPSSDWPFSVGVGDRYELVFRLNEKPVAALKLRLEIFDDQGKAYGIREVEVPAGAPALVRMRTPTSINAGNYIARLTVLGPSSVTLRHVDVE